MRKLIANQIPIKCNDVDFTTSTDIEVYIRQGSNFFQYTPTVIDAHNIVVDMPFADAKTLEVGSVVLQWALTDSDGKPVSPDPIIIEVGDFIKSDGYNPE